MSMVTASPTLDAGEISIARLHGEACFDCGSVYADLLPAGTVQVGGRAWDIVACTAHLPRRVGHA